MRTPRTVVVATLLACLAVLPGPAHATDELTVTGYALPSTTGGLVARNAPGLDTLTVVSLSLTSDGRRFVVPDKRAAGVGKAARGHGLRTEMLIGNYSNALGAFDPEAVGALLADPGSIARASRQVARRAVAGGWDGVNVDFEGMHRRDGRGLVEFLGALRSELPADRTLTIDVSASGTKSAYLARGYRLAEIATIVDAVQLMTYDEHGPGWSTPGPIGSLDWQRACVTEALRQVPATKLDLGVAGYGYLWKPDGSGRTLLVRSARNLAARAGATPRWHAGVGEWSARLGNGSTLWWSDARSLAARRQLATELGLRGLAVWRIGSADTVR